MSAADEIPYFASKHAHHHTGAPIYFYASPSRRWVELHRSSDPIVPVRVREWSEGDPPSPYFGWLDASDTTHYTMVWPSEAQLDMCFIYGPEAEEARGRGRKVRLVVEEVTP